MRPASSTVRPQQPCVCPEQCPLQSPLCELCVNVIYPSDRFIDTRNLRSARDLLHPPPTHRSARTIVWRSTAERPASCIHRTLLQSRSTKFVHITYRTRNKYAKFILRKSSRSISLKYFDLLIRCPCAIRSPSRLPFWQAPDLFSTRFVLVFEVCDCRSAEAFSWFVAGLCESIVSKIDYPLLSTTVYSLDSTHCILSTATIAASKRNFIITLSNSSSSSSLPVLAFLASSSRRSVTGLLSAPSSSVIVQCYCCPSSLFCLPNEPYAPLHSLWILSGYSLGTFWIVYK